MQARPLFLAGLAAVYSCAFISYYLQFEGLFGIDGLMPAGLHHRKVAERLGGRPLQDKLRAHPSLLWLLRKDDDIDVALELVSVVGIVCSFLGVAGANHGALFLIMFSCYLTLFSCGQTFLSFQWDLFLLETGALAILYAPWLSNSARDEAGAAHPMTWVLRASWVKFMVMSGAVKVFAHCPTWKELTGALLFASWSHATQRPMPR